MPRTRAFAPAALTLGLLSVVALQPSAASAAGTVQGDILARYVSLGGPRGFLGQPLTDELPTPANTGRYNVFQGGSVYWTNGVGAWEVHGAIRDKWGSVGYEKGYLGFPTSNEDPLVADGRFNRFQGGQVYWTPGTGAHTVLGAIFAHWGEYGFEAGPLGYPTSDETPTPERVGAFNSFTGNASIYWSPETGAAEIGGDIRSRWGATGYENGPLGFPVSDELDVADSPGRVNIFELGTIEWQPGRGAHVTGAAGEVTAVDAAANTFRIGAVEETYHYRAATDTFLQVSAEDGDADPVELTAEEFEAQLDVGSLVVASTQLDPAQPRVFVSVLPENNRVASPAALSQVFRMAEAKAGVTR